MTNANVYSSLPGPLSKELLERREKLFPAVSATAFRLLQKKQKARLLQMWTAIRILILPAQSAR